MRVLVVFLSPESGEICIEVTVKPKVVARGENKAIVEGALEVPANANESIFMALLWGVCISCTLVSGERDVRASMPKIQQHANDTGIIDATACIRSVEILAKGSFLGRSVNRGGIF